MTRRSLTLAAVLVAGLLAGCHLIPPGPPGPIGERPVAPVRAASLRVAFQRAPIGAPAAAMDTAVTNASWTIPPEDGRGAVDSMKVIVTRFTGGASLARLVPITTTQFEDRQAIPFGASTWTVSVQVCRYRRALPSCVSASGDLVVADAAPAPVAGLNVLGRKIPPA